MTVAVEGIVDAAVAGKILKAMGLELGPVHGQKGKNWLDAKLPGYNNGARFAPWLVLRDLDQDAECAPALLPSLLRAPATNMRLRIAVRSVEAWLLADSERISDFLRVPERAVPGFPDGLPDAKQTFVDLAHQSQSREIRKDLVPEIGTSGKVGPGYTSRLIEFAVQRWRPRVAARDSDSLSRCLASLEILRSRKSNRT